MVFGVTAGSAYAQTDDVDDTSIEDELEEAGGALKSYHARRGNLAALKQKMTPSKGGMAPVAKTKERAYEEWAEKQKMMKEATRRAGL